MIENIYIKDFAYQYDLIQTLRYKNHIYTFVLKKKIDSVILNKE